MADVADVDFEPQRVTIETRSAGF
jgi:hypothetical protein